MAGYYKLIQLHSAAVIQSGEASIIVPLPPLTIAIYRLRCTASSASTCGLSVSAHMIVGGGFTLRVGRTPSINGPGQLGMGIQLPVTSLQIQYDFSAAGPTFTVTDELEVIG